MIFRREPRGDQWLNLSTSLHVIWLPGTAEIGASATYPERRFGADPGHWALVRLAPTVDIALLATFDKCGHAKHMGDPSDFTLLPRPFPRWLGGEPRVFAFDQEDNFPEGLPSIAKARLIDVQYRGGGITTLLEDLTAAAGVAAPGSFQAVLENLEALSQEIPLVVVVRGADRLLADVGPAVVHFMTGWEGFTHHGSGISAMYLALETGARAVTQSAFYPGGVVDWARK